MIKLIKNYYVVFIAILLIIINQALLGIDKNGRAVYPEFLSMADRLLAGETLYSNVFAGEYFLQSIYFPGIPYLIAFIKSLLNFNDGATLILLSIISFFSIYFSLLKLSIKFGCGLGQSLLALTIAFGQFFDYFFFYLTEGKSDALMISTAILAYFLLNDILLNKDSRVIKAMFLLFVFIFLGLLKQQSIAIFAGIFIFLLADKSFSIRLRMTMAGNMMAASVIVAIIILSHNNAYFMTVEAVHMKEFNPVFDNAKLFYYELKNSWFYISVVVSSIWINYKKIMLNTYFKMWFIVSICFLAISILSFLRYGGNEANLQTGFILFMPFFVLLINDIMDKSADNKKVIYSILFFAIIKNMMSAVDHYYDYLLNDINNHAVQEYLGENYRGANVLFSASDYFTLKASGLNPVYVYETYSRVENFFESDYLPINNNVDLIIGNFPLFDYKNFKLDESINIPKLLKNRIYTRNTT